MTMLEATQFEAKIRKIQMTYLKTPFAQSKNFRILYCQQDSIKITSFEGTVAWALPRIKPGICQVEMKLRPKPRKFPPIQKSSKFIGSNMESFQLWTIKDG